MKMIPVILIRKPGIQEFKMFQVSRFKIFCINLIRDLFFVLTLDAKVALGRLFVDPGVAFDPTLSLVDFN